MIFIKKDSFPPEILVENKQKWTEELLENIKKYKGFSNIPHSIKNTMWMHYRHDDIKKKLFASSNQKCAFCESKPAESGNIEVEHFKPKSIYPELAFEWDNLLPICRKCNDSKNDHDTGKKPIVNPCIEDPEKIFTYHFLNIIPKDEKNEVAERTIDVCNLNSERLYESRVKLMKALCSYEKVVDTWLKEISNADTDRKRIRRINKLRDSLDILEGLTRAEEPYAGYCRYFLNQSKVYKEAQLLIKEQ